MDRAAVRDARYLTKQEREARRQEALQLHLDGVPVMEIVHRTGLAWGTVNRVITRFQDVGQEAVKAANPGPAKGQGAKLDSQQQRLVLERMRQRPPSYGGFGGQLWTRNALQQLVQVKFGVEINTRSLGDYLAGWGVASPDNSGGLPRERCSSSVQEWVGANYERLRQRQSGGGAAIFWLNATIDLDAVVWLAPADVSPGSKKPQQYCLASVTNSQGGLMWMVLDKPLNTARQLKFLQALAKDAAGRTVMLIRHDLTAFSGDALSADANKKNLPLEIFP